MIEAWNSSGVVMVPGNSPGVVMVLLASQRHAFEDKFSMTEFVHRLGDVPLPLKLLKLFLCPIVSIFLHQLHQTFSSSSVVIVLASCPFQLQVV